MSVRISGPASKRWRMVGIIAIAAGLIGGAGIPASAAGSAGVQPTAAAPEAWEAFDDNRSLAARSSTRFAFSVPAGNYTISAKFYVFVSNTIFVSCQLSAGGNFDRAAVGIGSSAPGTGAVTSVALSVAHAFPTAGSIVLDCENTGSSNATLNFVKITATRVNALTHIGL